MARSKTLSGGSEARKKSSPEKIENFGADFGKDFWQELQTLALPSLQK